MILFSIYYQFNNNFHNFENDISFSHFQARLILIKFNHIVTKVHDARSLENVPELSTDNYKPGGNTALYDAVGEGIRIGEAALNEGERVLVLIMTGKILRKKSLQNNLAIMKLHTKLCRWTRERIQKFLFIPDKNKNGGEGSPRKLDVCLHRGKP